MKIPPLITLLLSAAVHASMVPEPLQQGVLQPTQLHDVKVPVVLGVMSRCPDAILCESVFDEVIGEVGNKIDLTLTFIGTYVFARLVQISM